MCKKLTLVALASIVIFKSLSRKTLHIPFLIFSISRGFALKAASPSSQCKPMFWHSVLIDLKVLQTGLDKCAQNESQTSIDFRLLRPPTLLQTVLNQSCTSVLSIQPFAWHLTTTSLGKFKFLGNVFHLNTT